MRARTPVIMKAHQLLVACIAWLMAAPADSASKSPEQINVDGSTWHPRLLIVEDFTDPEWRNRWAIEGRGTAEIEGGRLQILAPGGSGGVTVWLRKQLPPNVLVECRAGSNQTSQSNATNLNLVLHAREPDGAPYQFGRSGKYSEYKRFPNYIFTLTGDFEGQPGHARLRRNPGFALMNGDPTLGALVGHSYHLRVLILDGRLRYWVDGRLIHNARDEHPLLGGHFGLRTWKSEVWWSDLKIYRLDLVNGSGNSSQNRLESDELIDSDLQTPHFAQHLRW